MASPTQTIMFTAMPRGLAIDPARLPVSVLVSPRLTGATKLGAFPDWLDWTQNLKTKGMKITFDAGGATHTADIDTGILQPACGGRYSTKRPWLTNTRSTTSASG